MRSVIGRLCRSHTLCLMLPTLPSIFCKALSPLHTADVQDKGPSFKSVFFSFALGKAISSNTIHGLLNFEVWTVPEKGMLRQVWSSNVPQRSDAARNGVFIEHIPVRKCQNHPKKVFLKRLNFNLNPHPPPARKREERQLIYAENLQGLGLIDVSRNSAVKHIHVHLHPVYRVTSIVSTCLSGSVFN